MTKTIKSFQSYSWVFSPEHYEYDGKCITMPLNIGLIIKQHTNKNLVIATANQHLEDGKQEKWERLKRITLTKGGGAQ